jgi:glycosyltransferase involved in cell wall biosynthesis
MRSEFKSRYGVRNVVVAHPSVEHLAVTMDDEDQASPNPSYRFFYPAYPRTFKNIEQILNAARILESRGFNQFEVWLTLDGTETRYAANILREFSDLTTVKWLGLLPRSEVMRLYAKTDCLIFPSKLETWGMPITEFKTTGKPILIADLPYAYETIGEYEQGAFFKIGDDAQLAEMMKHAAMGEAIFRPTNERDIAPPFSRNWQELWKILLSAAEARN